jgi:hypothetical protein
MANITPEMARAELARRELAKRQSLNNVNQENGLNQIPSDLGNTAINLIQGAGEKAMQIPGEIGEAAQSFQENPFNASHRASKGVLSGLAEGGKQLYNLPLNLTSYLSKIGFPGFKSGFPFADSPQNLGDIAEKLKIGETGLEKKFMGEPQKGDQLWKDIGEIVPAFLAPESLSAKVPAVTSKGIIKQLSKEKTKQIGIAKKEYSNLFNEAASKGLTNAIPLDIVMHNSQQIVKNSIPKYHTSLKKYIENPSIENAHWAQSELGALERHLDKISNKNGLTPSQIKTYKAVKEARKGIKKSMFSDNALGANPGLAMKYEQLGNKYRENVIPYTSLEDLSLAESGKLRPKTAVQNLLKDEEFMMKLAKKNLGIFAHTPLAKKIGLGATGLLGYDELKKLLK